MGIKMKITEDSVIQVYWYKKKKKAMVSKNEWTVQKDCIFIISNCEKMLQIMSVQK